ncbi:MAG: polyphosphate kinase 1 [Ignavibacteriales bacterium]|nr:polyphosphate kinase 1 [Ignavibacteriales bacterium]
MSVKEITKKYNNPANFINRETSWIEFNKRVLEEALNPELPLLEKIKFLSIFSSNLDEFYMIRLSGIKEQIHAGFSEPTIDGLTPIEQMKIVDRNLRPMIEECQSLWKYTIVPELRNNGVFIYTKDDLEEEDRASLNDYFKREIFPVLTPLAFDPGRPFPYISNLSLSLAIQVRSPKGEEHFARVKVPNSLPRLLRFDTLSPSGKNNSLEGPFKFIWLGDVIKMNLQLLFPKMEVIRAHRFRITRDCDIEIQEDEADDLLTVIEENIRQRKFGSVVRLEVEKEMPEYLINTLIENLEITRDDVNIIDGPLALSNVILLYGLPLHQLKEKPFLPVVPKVFEAEDDFFSTIRERDVMLHHPYDSFSPVIEFIKQASMDPDVLAIKQTLYRVGPNSPVVKYLIEAAERGKQVAVLVELKARFDEENNIFWARELEKVGAHVVYGLVGLKTHAKMTLVVRRELDGLRRYVHVATGNYNAATAKIYTDMGLFTTNPEICDDVTNIFNYLTGYSKQSEFNKLFVAPINLRESVSELILREIHNAREGKTGRIIMKMNALVDPVIISLLYEASAVGVQVDLIIRGICSLIAGKPGLSDNIRVRSIVGRFLEHSRILYFYNDGSEDVFLTSADMMQRNLDRRVEIAFPVLDRETKRQLINIVLKVYLLDNQKAHILQPDGVYSHIEKEEDQKPLNSQDWFMGHCTKVFKKHNYKVK